MNAKNLLDYYYWTHQPYIAHGTTLWIYVGGFLLLIIAGLICKIIAQYKENKIVKNILRRFGNIGTVMGFLGLLWMFFRQERAIFLAWRFWLLLWVLVFIWWIFRVVWYMFRRVPEIKAEEDKRKKIEKYLPGRG
jgi:hypothetical protein